MTANDLQESRDNLRQRRVSLKRARTSLLAVLLAFTALLGMNVVSAMHSAIPHGGGHAHQAMDHDFASADDHDAADHGNHKSDPDKVTHQAMHEIVHGIGLPQVLAASPTPVAARQHWQLATTRVIEGIAPPSLLRPPQA